MSALHQALKAVMAGETLEAEAMEVALGEVMEGQASDVHLAAFLTALRVRGETDDEVLGAVQAMRRRATRLELGADHLGPVLDTCGTGGDGAGTFNISTAVAFVCAGAGVTVAKHGNRAVSSRVGSADVLEALGVRIDLGPAQVGACIESTGIGFLFAPKHHGALRHAGPVRRALGYRTLLNMLGPMTNPAGATHQLLGHFDGERLAQVAGVLGRLGSARALVVHGEDGLDELSLAAPTHAALWDGGEVQTMTLRPEDAGLERAPLEALAGGDAATNASILHHILSGGTGAPADVVRWNAGAALWVAERADDLRSGVELATRSLASGAALESLEALIRVSGRVAAEAAP